MSFAALAVLVADGVSVSSGSRVSVFTNDGAVLPAAAAFVEEVYRRGGQAQVVHTDEQFDASAIRWATDVVLRQPPPVEEAALRWSDVHVSFRGLLPPVGDLPGARVAALREGRGRISTLRWEGTRWAIVRVPTPQWAGLVSLDAQVLMDEWSASFAEDWPRAEARLVPWCRDLEKASTVHILGPDTDLVLCVEGRTWVPFAGRANWPDGEIATAPVEDKVNGHITFPGRFWFSGLEIADLRLEFAAGKVTAAAASVGADFVTGLLETDEGARRVGEFGIGLNGALTTPTGDLLIDEKILGTVHIALGRSYPECGGRNRSALHWDIVKDLRGLGTVRVGEHALIQDGVVSDELRRYAVAVPDATP